MFGMKGLCSRKLAFFKKKGGVLGCFGSFSWGEGKKLVSSHHIGWNYLPPTLQDGFGFSSGSPNLNIGGANSLDKNWVKPQGRLLPENYEIEDS